MTLTRKQETAIADFMATATITNQFYSYADIRSALGETCSDISSQSLGKIIRDIAKAKSYEVTVKKEKSTMLAIRQVSKVVKIVKNKSIVSFLDSNDNVVVSFDYCSNDSSPFHDILPLADSLNFISVFLSNINRYTQIPEYVWSYIDLFQDLYERGLFTGHTARYIIAYFNTIPKGYMKFIQEYGVDISETSLNAFKLLNNGYPARFVKNLINEQNNSFIYGHHLVAFTYNDYLKIQKVMINSIKNNSNFSRGDVDTLCYSIRRNGIEMLDTNRDIATNVKIYKNYEHIEKNEKLSKELQKLNFLNGLTIDDYIVVVPQGIEDLQAEGKQQHNCVSHYYNDSIIKHENLIYFLRKKENLEKSVVTCRYNFKNKKTVEHRIVNNWNTSSVQDAIIAEIDTIINETLV